MSDTPTPSWRGLGWAVGVTALGLVATRFVDLARQSPWNDEVCNWMWALEWPIGATPPHPLTYAAIKAALALGDGVYTLRLPSAVVMSLVGLALVAWLWRAVAPKVACVFAAVWVLSPMAIFYSQDANHYAWVTLAGAAALVAAWRWWQGTGGRRVAELLVLGAVCGAMKWGHPMAVFALIGLAVAVMADALRRPNALPLMARVPAVVVRGVVGGLAIVAIATAVTVFQAQAATANQGRLEGAVYFTLEPEFQARLLSNAFGAYMHGHGLDYLAGLVGFAACVAGWTILARRHEGALGAAVGMGASYIALGAFFLSFDFSHSFHVRFAVFLLPGLLVGWASAVATLVEAVQMIQRGERDRIAPATKLVAGLGAVAVATFALSWSRWAGAYYGGELQPARGAMAWIAANTKRDTIVATRSVFLAQSLAFLNARLPGDQRRDYRFLGEKQPSSHNAAMLARRWALERPVALLDMASIDEPINVDYARFVADLPELARFGSNVPRDFFGFDRSLVIRVVMPDDTLGTLPVDGDDAHRLFPLDGAGFISLPDSRGNPARMLAVRAGSTATTYVAPPTDAATVWLDTQILAPAEVAVCVVTTVEGQPPVVHQALRGGAAEAKVSLRVAAGPVPTGAVPAGAVAGGRGVDVDVMLALDPGMAAGDVDRIVALPVAWRAEPTFAPPSQVWGLDAESATRFGRDNEQFAAAPPVVPPLDYAADVANVALGDVAAVGHPRLLAFRLEATGLSSQVVVPELAWTDGDGQRRSVRLSPGTRSSVSFGPVTHYAIVPTWWSGRDVEARLRLLRTMVQGPHGGHVRATPPVLYDLVSTGS